MKWAGHVARVGKRRVVYRVFWGTISHRDHLEKLVAVGKIILRWIFRTWDGGYGLD
jgi:hypothetical protein